MKLRGVIITLKNGYGNRVGCFTIFIMRKFGVVVFSGVLFLSLLSLAFSTSAHLTLSHPKKVEKWLSQSGLYGSFVDTAIDQADKTAGDDQSGGVSLSDTAVKQAAESAFSSQLIQKNVNTFLDSNYAWLQGKSEKPRFTIDLTKAKTNFADKVGRYVTAYLSTLPACTAAQNAQIDFSTVDPLTLQCRPNGVDPQAEGELVAEQMASNGDFLSNTVITPETFSSQGDTDTTPYYKKYASAPATYQLATKIPWIAGALTIFSAGAVLFLTVRKRKGLKIIGILLAAAGLTLVFTKLVSDQIFRVLERQIFNEGSVGALQKSLTGFLHHLEDQLVKMDFWFGVGYLLLALIILIILVSTRQRGLRIPKPLQTLTPSDDPSPEATTGRPLPGNQPKPAPKARPPKPRRLIQ